MPSRPVSVLASLVIFGTTFSLSAQQSVPSARLVRAEGHVTLNGQPVAAGASAVTLGDVSDLQTTEGRVVIALKRGGTLVFSENTSARVHANGVYNFNRIEILAGSAVLLSASSSPLVAIRPPLAAHESCAASRDTMPSAVPGEAERRHDTTAFCR